MKYFLWQTKFLQIIIYILIFPVTCFGGTTLFQEDFEDTNFASRGWYDSPSGALDTSQFVPGSTRSLICTLIQGATNCSGNNGAMRHTFTPTNSVYVSYWVKYSTNYVGSGQTYHPHEFYLLTNLNGAYNGLAWNYLTAYIEQNVQAGGGVPRLSIQDGQNIDETKIGSNLVGVTENRAVAGCNGDSDGYGNGTCYLSGSVHWNGKTWDAPQAYFTSTPGPYYKNDWHFIEVYFNLNTIINGIGQKDGIIQYWFDNIPVININNAVLRTGKNPTMQFNQFIIAPYIGNGSPVAQSFWIDNLTVATSRPAANTAPPSPPTSLKVQ